MSTRRQRFIGAVMASAAFPGMVAGCASAGPSNDELRATIETAMVETVPTVTGALVNVFSSGTEGQGIGIKLYVDDATPESLAETIDTALGTAWKISDFQPTDISISAVDGPKPTDAKMGSIDGVDLAVVATSLGFDPTLSSLDVLMVPADALSQRYGEWEKSSGE